MDIEEEKDAPIRVVEPLVDPVPRKEPRPERVEPVRVPEKVPA